jgi:hypothetical protein
LINLIKSFKDPLLMLGCNPHTVIGNAQQHPLACGVLSRQVDER